jgi:outer membrane protein
MMTKYFLKLSSFSALSLALFMGLSTAEAMDLKEALAIAYKNNPDLKQQRNKLEAVDENVTQAYSGFLPNVTANGSYSYEKANSDSLTGIDTGNKNTPTAASLQIQQNLFAGGRSVEGVDRSENQVMSERAQLHAKEQQILSETVGAYIDIVRTKEILALSKHNEKVLSQEVEANRTRLNLGDATKTDVSQAESRYAKATSDRISAEGNLIEARSQFKKLTLVEAPDDVYMPKALPTIPKTLDDAVDKAKKYNPQIISAEYGTKVSENDINLALGALLPTVNLSGAISRTDNNYDKVFNQSFATDSTTDQVVRLSVSIPLYQGGDEYSKIRQAKDNKDAAIDGLESTKSFIISAVTSSWKDLNTARANIDANNKAVKAARFALESIREEQAAGTRTTLDVLDQEQELFIAQVNLANAKRNEVIALFNLLTTMGELTAKNLKLDVKLHDPNKHLEEVKYKPFGLGD